MNINRSWFKYVLGFLGIAALMTNAPAYIQALSSNPVRSPFISYLIMAAAIVLWIGFLRWFSKVNLTLFRTAYVLMSVIGLGLIIYIFVFLRSEERPIWINMLRDVLFFWITSAMMINPDTNKGNSL